MRHESEHAIGSQDTAIVSYAFRVPRGMVATRLDYSGLAPMIAKLV